MSRRAAQGLGHLSLIVMLLAGVLGAEWVFLRQWQEERKAVLSTVHEQPENTSEPEAFVFPESPDMEIAQELRQRPLFIHTRRPAEPAVPELAPVETDGRELLLTSTIIAPEGRFALARDAETGLTVVLREGQQEGRWYTETIEADRVILRSGPDTQVLRLRPDSLESGPSDRDVRVPEEPRAPEVTAEELQNGE